MESESLFFFINRLPHLRGIFNSFSNSFIDFYSNEIVSSSDIRKRKAQSSGQLETSNLLHVTSWKMLHLERSYMSQHTKKYLKKLSTVYSTDWKSSLNLNKGNKNDSRLRTWQLLLLDQTKHFCRGSQNRM